MKKLFRNLSLMFIAAIMVFALAACGGPTMEEVVGEYEMTDVSVTITYEGTTINAGKENFKYFTMTFKEDGTATVSSEYATGEKYSSTGTFTCGNGKIQVTTTENGVTATETYKYSDGVITFQTHLSQMGMTISMSIELTKVVTETFV